mgnify:CR=1 FL=1
MLPHGIRLITSTRFCKRMRSSLFTLSIWKRHRQPISVYSDRSMLELSKVERKSKESRKKVERKSKESRTHDRIGIGCAMYTQTSKVVLGSVHVFALCNTAQRVCQDGVLLFTALFTAVNKRVFTLTPSLF